MIFALVSENTMIRKKTQKQTKKTSNEKIKVSTLTFPLKTAKTNKQKLPRIVWCKIKFHFMCNISLMLAIRLYDK